MKNWNYKSELLRNKICEILNNIFYNNTTDEKHAELFSFLKVLMSQFAVQRDLKFLLDQCNYSKFFAKPQLHIFPTEIINFSQIMMLFVAEQLGKHYMTGL